MFHVRIDTPPWGPNPSLAALDYALRIQGSTQLNVTMQDIPLEDDGDHFTRAGQRAFSHALVRAIPQNSSESMLVIADSTIDFHNWSGDEWTGWASSVLVDAFQGRNVVVDAVCGSGFIARSRHGEHFHARLSNHLRGGFRGGVVFIGGWNDERTGRIDDTIAAIHKCTSLVDRYA
jgi:hypothetical protein